MTRRAVLFLIAIGLSFINPSAGWAQKRILRVVSQDSQPIAFANVSIEGGITQITDEKGNVDLGAGKSQTLTMRVMRIGYRPWFGKVDLPDSAVVRTVTLPSLAQSLAPTVITESSAPLKSPLQLAGFYDRWLMRQKGMLSAVFISPEELEFRHPDRITGMLYGLNGVQLSRACVEPPDRRGNCLQGLVAFSAIKRMCPMTIVVDGLQVYASAGANVNIDMLLNASDVAAIELYARGGNMPVNFQFQDVGCGVLAFWTGSRKPY